MVDVVDMMIMVIMMDMVVEDIYGQDWQDGGTYPCFDEGDDRPDWNAGHGGGREDSSCPVSVMMLTKFLSKKFKPPVQWAQAG